MLASGSSWVSVKDQEEECSSSAPPVPVHEPTKSWVVDQVAHRHHGSVGDWVGAQFQEILEETAGFGSSLQSGCDRKAAGYATCSYHVRTSWAAVERHDALPILRGPAFVYPADGEKPWQVATPPGATLEPGENSNHYAHARVHLGY